MEPIAFFYVPLTFILSPIVGERIKVRGHLLSIAVPLFIQTSIISLDDICVYFVRKPRHLGRG